MHILIPALRRQRQADLWESEAQRGLQSKFQDSRGYTENLTKRKSLVNKLLEPREWGLKGTIGDQIQDLVLTR